MHRWLLFMLGIVGCSSGVPPLATWETLPPRTALIYLDTLAEATTDPGGIAYHRGCAWAAAGELPDAERWFTRCLEDDQIPPGRYAAAVYNRGLCWLLARPDRVGTRQAIADLLAARDAPGATEQLRADAAWNLSIAKSRWQELEAAERAKPPEGRDPSPVEPEPPKPTPPAPPPMSEPGPSSGSPGGATAGNGAATVPSDAAGPQGPGVGLLPLMPEVARVEPVSAEQARARLTQQLLRLEAERRQLLRTLAPPEKGYARDW
ncbi:MAG: hypothetical protein ACRCZF_25835 [Gemmataceae bacterium]